MTFKSNAKIIDIQELLDSADPSIELPTIIREPSEFTLEDHDELASRIVGKEELMLSHVDSNIKSIAPLQADPWTLSRESIDSQEIKITYFDGRKASIRLGEISKNRGRHTSNYIKINGISFPLDDNGALLMNGENTPVLSNLRFTFHAALRTESTKRLEVISIAAAFGAIIGRNGGIGSGEALDEVITIVEKNAF